MSGGGERRIYLLARTERNPDPGQRLLTKVFLLQAGSTEVENRFRIFFDGGFPPLFTFAGERSVL